MCLFQNKFELNCSIFSICLFRTVVVCTRNIVKFADSRDRAGAVRGGVSHVMGQIKQVGTYTIYIHLHVHIFKTGSHLQCSQTVPIFGHIRMFREFHLQVLPCLSV